MNSAYKQLFAAIRCFVSLSSDEEDLLQTLFVERQSCKGDFFIKEESLCKEVGFINKGLVRYFISNEDGGELIYDFGCEGNFVCNYESFLDHSPSRKNIQFLEDTGWLSISYDKLQVMYKELTEGERFGRLVCEQIFVDALHKITSLYTCSPEERYRQFTDTYPGLQQRIPQYFISSFVGIQPQSLSRIRKRLSRS